MITGYSKDCYYTTYEYTNNRICIICGLPESTGTVIETDGICAYCNTKGKGMEND